MLEPEISQRSEFYSELRAAETAPFWEVVDRSREPNPVTVAHHWRWAEVEPLLRRAGELVDTDEAERRVLMLVNPATRGEKRAVGTLYAGMQIVLPGEVARAHRHTASALRFVLKGGGASTIVDGTSLAVARFDLVLTPAMAWHDHVNRGAEPVVWLDALDSPLTRALDAWFFEPHPEGVQAAVEADIGSQARSLRYGWEEMSAALDRVLDADDVAVVDYTDPETGRHVFPTIRCRAIKLRPGGAYGPVRRVGSGVFCVVEGRGVARVGGERFELGFGDVFCVPSWSWLSVECADQQALAMFTYDDEPVLQALGKARSERGDER
jgi:gentisate 1,2-dioxygenase